MDDAITCLTILLTWRCPAACAHCVFDSGPRNTLTLDIAVARAAVEAAARLSPRPALSFSGGEPFVALPAMRALIALAAAHGMPSEVVTSCAWVATPDRTRAMLAELQASGLVVLCVSYDRHHEPFIPGWKVATAIRAGLALGLRVVVNVLEGEGHVNTPAALANALALSPDEVGAVHLHGQATLSVGRARRELDGFLPRAEVARGGCRHAGSVPTLSPRGTLFPCCGPVVGESEADARLFVLGALDDTGFDAMRRDLFVRLLATIGPEGILRAVATRPDAPRLDRGYVNQCDMCLEMTTRGEVTEAVEAWLGDLVHE